MKNLFVVTTCWIWMLAVHPLRAGDDIAISGILANLNAVPATELPDRAAAMVKRCSPPRRVAMATNVVRAALMINPVATPMVIAAIARVVPEVTAASANAATLAQPSQAVEITRAAVAVVRTARRKSWHQFVARLLMLTKPLL